MPSASFTDDLGADSLDLVELIMGLEEEFSTTEKAVKIPDEDAAKIKNGTECRGLPDKQGHNRYGYQTRSAADQRSGC